MTYEEFMNKIINSGRERPKSFSDKKRGYENHHIIPRCMGGSNKTDNLIRLTISEHLVAHILLFRENPNNHGLANAATGMMGKNKGLRDYVATIVDNEEEFYEIINTLAKSREVTRDYMATIMRDKNAGANNHQACAVICLETRETFATIRSASESVGIKDISRALKSIAFTAGGYHWMKLCEWNSLSEDEKKAQLNISHILAKQRSTKKVICLETQEVFDSVKMASKVTKCNVSSISACCHKNYKQTSGRHWMFLNEWNNLSLSEKNSIIEKLTYPRNAKRAVICLETLQIFKTVTDANKWCGCQVGDCCRGKNKIAGGYHWMFLNDWENLSDENKNERFNSIKVDKPHALIGCNNPKSRAVICLETDEVFDTITSATNAVSGKSTSSISGCCNGRLKTAYGYHWMYLDEYKNGGTLG